MEEVEEVGEGAGDCSHDSQASNGALCNCIIFSICRRYSALTCNSSTMSEYVIFATSTQVRSIKWEGGRKQNGEIRSDAGIWRRDRVEISNVAYRTRRRQRWE